MQVAVVADAITTLVKDRVALAAAGKVADNNEVALVLVQTLGAVVVALIMLVFLEQADLESLL